MTQLQDAPKRGRGRPVNPDSLHHQMGQMAVSDEVALFVPAECASQKRVAATGGVLRKNLGDGRRYSTAKSSRWGVPGTWVWRIA